MTEKMRDNLAGYWVGPTANGSTSSEKAEVKSKANALSVETLRESLQKLSGNSRRDEGEFDQWYRAATAGFWPQDEFERRSYRDAHRIRHDEERRIREIIEPMAEKFFKILVDLAERQPNQKQKELPVKLDLQELTKVKDEAEKELQSERVESAKAKIKSKLREIERAELVVRNAKRELDDLYAEMGS